MTDMNLPETPSALIGWREWVGLPQLNLARVKAKIDTGARSSALHAFDIQPFEVNGKARVRFKVHPLQRQQHTIEAEADLLEERMVRDSGGHTQQRPVILTVVQLGNYCWPIELTLTNRDAMGFRMLLGRQAVRQRFLIDPGCSFLLSSSPATSQSV